MPPRRRFYFIIATAAHITPPYLPLYQPRRHGGAPLAHHAWSCAVIHRRGQGSTLVACPSLNTPRADGIDRQGGGIAEIKARRVAASGAINPAGKSQPSQLAFNAFLPPQPMKDAGCSRLRLLAARELAIIIITPSSPPKTELGGLL